MLNPNILRRHQRDMAIRGSEIEMLVHTRGKTARDCPQYDTIPLDGHGRHWGKIRCSTFVCFLCRRDSRDEFM